MNNTEMILVHKYQRLIEVEKSIDWENDSPAKTARKYSDIASLATQVLRAASVLGEGHNKAQEKFAYASGQGGELKKNLLWWNATKGAAIANAMGL